MNESIISIVIIAVVITANYISNMLERIYKGGYYGARKRIEKYVEVGGIYIISFMCLALGSILSGGYKGSIEILMDIVKR